MERGAAADGGGERGVKPARKLRILMVAPYPIFPAWSGGKVRVLALARNLSQIGHEVTVATPLHPAQRRVLYRDEAFEIRQIPYPFLIPLFFTDRPFPYGILASFHPGMKVLAAPLFRGFDVIQFEQSSFAGLLPGAPSSALVTYDAHNVEFDYVRQECSSPRIADMVGGRAFRLERELVMRSAHVFAVSSVDQHRLGKLYGLAEGNCTVAANGIPSATRASGDRSAMCGRFPALRRFRRLALFSGSDVAHNRQAVEYLLKNLAPKTREIAFLIHGNCGRRFQRRAGLANVFFDGDYRTFTDYAVEGGIGLNPMESGGGTNLKVLQYLSHGLPVLSTPFGMRGYPDLERNVRIRERKDFSSALMEPGFPDPPDPGSLMCRYSWRKIAEDVSNAYLDKSHG